MSEQYTEETVTLTKSEYEKFKNASIHPDIQQNRPGTTEIDLIDVLLAMLNKWWIIVLCTILCAGAAFAFFYNTWVPQYTATAMVYVNNDSLSLGSTKVSITSGDIDTGKKLIDTYGVILKTHLTLNEVISQAKAQYGYELDYFEMLKVIEGDSVGDTAVFSITVKDHDPEKAINITNIIVDVLPDQISTVIDGTGVRTVDYAEEATPVGSGLLRKTVIGALIGFIISAGTIALADSILNDSIESTDYLKEVYSDIPILAEIPDAETHDHSGYYKGYGKYGKYSKYGKYGKYYKNNYYKRNDDKKDK